jgi:hypothetical protein
MMILTRGGHLMLVYRTNRRSSSRRSAARQAAALVQEMMPVMVFRFCMNVTVGNGEVFQ